LVVSPFSARDTQHPITVREQYYLFCHVLLTSGGVAYIGTDYPRTWDIGFLPPIRMNIESTKHYQLSGYNADGEWAALAPNNGALYLGSHRQPFSISLFHQLRCLDIIRRDVAEVLPQEESRLSRHCLNYMRQMVLCRADLAVDPVMGRELEAEVRAETNQCVDWRRVYQKLEENQREYAKWVEASPAPVRNDVVQPLL
jgi:hypothetical protein